MEINWTSAFDGSVRVHACFHLSGSSVFQMNEKHGSYMYSNIHKSTTKRKRTDLLYRLFGISDLPGGRLLRYHTYSETTSLRVKALVQNLREKD